MTLESLDGFVRVVTRRDNHRIVADRRGLAKAVRQGTETLRSLAPLELHHVVFVHKGLQPRHHRRRGRHLLHRFLRVEPTTGVVITQAHHFGFGDGLIAEAGLVFHAPQHKPAGGLGARIQVVALGIVCKQFDGVARMQPAFFALIFVKQPGRSAKAVFLQHHVSELPAPGLPAAGRSDGFDALHDDGDFKAGAKGGHKRCNVTDWQMAINLRAPKYLPMRAPMMPAWDTPTTQRTARPL